MLDLLFNPQGRITAGPFWQGVILLLVVGLLLSAASAYGPQSASVIVSLASLVLIYPSVCVYGKRFHDAGKSAWWYLLVIVVGIFLGTVTTIAILMPKIIAMIQQMQTMQQGSPEAQAFAQRASREMTRTSFLPISVATILITVIIAFFVARLRSDPAENRYGPASDDGAVEEAV